MEISPLKYLDYNVSQMLCEQIRLSQEGIARDFHIELYDKYKYSNPYKKDINEVFTFTYRFPSWQNLFLEYINIREIVTIYEEDLIEYHCKKLQRCGYDKISNYLTHRLNEY
jgi:site-specific recombinase